MFNFYDKTFAILHVTPLELKTRKTQPCAINIPLLTEWNAARCPHANEQHPCKIQVLNFSSLVKFLLSLPRLHTEWNNSTICAKAAAH